jgi:hypothetical protein
MEIGKREEIRRLFTEEIHVVYPLSEMLRSRSISDFEVFWIWKYLQSLKLQLSTPNRKIQILKCSEIHQLFEGQVSLQKLLDFGAFLISDFQIRDVQPESKCIN